MERQICLPKYSLLQFSIYKANAQTKLNFQHIYTIWPLAKYTAKREEKYMVYILFSLQFLCYCPLR